MADIERTGPNLEYTPAIGGNLNPYTPSVTTSSSSYANKNTLQNDLDKLFKLLDDFNDELDRELIVKGLPIDPLNDRLKEAHILSWPEQLGSTKSYVSYRYYNYVSLSNTTAANVIKKVFEESAREIGGTKALDLKKHIDSTKNEATLIQEFTKTYVGKLVDAAEHRTVELFQDWTQSALYHTGRFRSLFQTGVQAQLPQYEVDALSSSEARNSQAVFQVKLNDVNKSLAATQDYLDKNFTKHAPVFYGNFLGPALQFRLNVSSKFSSGQGVLGREVSDASKILDNNLQILQGDQLKRNAIYDKQSNILYDTLTQQTTLQNYIKQLSPNGQALPSNQGLTDVQDTEEEISYFANAEESVPDSDPALSIASPHNLLLGRDEPAAHPQYFLKAGDTLAGDLALEDGIRIDGIIPHTHEHDGLDGSAKIQGKNIVGGTLQISAIDNQEIPTRPENLRLFQSSVHIVPPGVASIDVQVAWDGDPELRYEVEYTSIID